MPRAPARPKAAASSAPRPRGPLAGFDVDEGPGAPPVELQLKVAIKKIAGKVLDLFRSWDSNGDGVITRVEFHKAMTLLGLNVAKEEIDFLFSAWSPDGDDELSLPELTRILRAPLVTESIRNALAKREVESVSDYFGQWAADAVADGTLTYDEYEGALRHLLGGRLDPKAARALFNSLDRESTGEISLERLEGAVGLVKKKAGPAVEVVEVVDVRAVQKAVRASVWSGYTARGIPVPLEEGENDAPEFPIRRSRRASLRLAPTTTLALAPSSSDAALMPRRIDVLSSPLPRSHPPARRWTQVVLPPKPPRLSPERIAVTRSYDARPQSRAQSRCEQRRARTADSLSMLSMSSLPELSLRLQLASSQSSTRPGFKPRSPLLGMSIETALLSI